MILLPLALGLVLLAQKPAPPPAGAEPPEEDVTLLPKEDYVFNPLQAAKEIKIGQYYLKKGSLKAAIKRFQEAAKWDPGSPDAFLSLGETYERMKDAKSAKAAYAKYLELAPDAKNAALIKKKLEVKNQALRLH